MSCQERLTQQELTRLYQTELYKYVYDYECSDFIFLKKIILIDQIRVCLNS